MAPVVVLSGGPACPVRRAMISAQIDTAVSSGVRAPTSRPIGDRTPGELDVGEPRLAQPLDALFVRAPAAHRSEIPHVGSNARHDRGDVELGVVSEHAHRIARPERVADGGQEPIGPVVHYLVRHRKPLGRREHGPRVTHRHAIPEELGRTRRARL